MSLLAQLVHRWGYLAIVVGTYLEGEGILLSAGALCLAGVLSPPWVVLCATLGSLAWGQTWFRVGALSGRALIARRPVWQARARVVESWLARSGPAVLLCGRFVVGMGMLLPTVIGASGYEWRRFTVIDGAGALIWAVVVTGAGWALGAGALWVSPSLGWLGLVAVAVVASVLGALIYRHYARVVARRLCEGGDRSGGSSNGRYA